MITFFFGGVVTITGGLLTVSSCVAIELGIFSVSNCVVGMRAVCAFSYKNGFNTILYSREMSPPVQFKCSFSTKVGSLTGSLVNIDSSMDVLLVSSVFQSNVFCIEE